MIISVIKTGYRNAVRNRIYTFLNLGGLIVGIVSFLFVTSYILDELSYDGYHPDVERLFRITDEMKFDDDLKPSAIIPSGWSDGFGTSIPEISTIGRIRQASRFNPIVKYVDRVFTENHFIFMDSTMLNIFHYEFIHKKPGNPLTYPDAILITEEMVSKYFGANNPLDEILTVDGDRSYRVTAVIRMPKNNSFQFNFAALLIPPVEDRVWTHTVVKGAKT